MTLAVSNTRTLPLGPCLEVTDMSEKSAGDPVRVVKGGAVVVRRELFELLNRYHRLFADLLELELRSTEPAELATLHGTAADWFAGHGFPVEAIRHAQAAQDWEQVWSIAAFLLEASVRDALGEREVAGRALEQALDLAEPDGLLFPFLLHPVPDLLERHARQRTAHPVLIQKIISALGGRTPAAPAASPPEQTAPAQGLSEHLPEPLSQAEARVLRFLQTSLSAPEIARELYVSVNTVRTHMRHLYDKLGVHRRLEAIDRARALGLLAPVPQRA